MAIFICQFPYTKILIYSNFLGGSILKAKIKSYFLIYKFQCPCTSFYLASISSNAKIGYLNKQLLSTVDIDTLKKCSITCKSSIESFKSSLKDPIKLYTCC